MLAVLPFLTWALAALMLLRRGLTRSFPSPPAAALLVAAGLCSAYLAIATELLSIFHALERGAVIAVWLIPVCWLTAALALKPAPSHPAPPRPDAPRLQCAALTLALAAILIGIGLIAATTPTNTIDCLAYHLPRQFYWIQQASVAHYPAFNLRQLEMPPLSEFQGVHLALLSGGWNWSNIPAWSSLVLAAIAAYALAAELGADPHGRLLGALLAITVPAAAMQATDGKNDIAVAAWTLALAVPTAHVWLRGRLPWGQAALAGLFAGPLVLTKGTGFVFALPLAALLAIGGLRARGLRAVGPGTLAAAIALVLNAGHFARNLHFFGSPLGLPESSGGYHLANHDFSPAALASNILRNLSLHIGGPWPAFNQWVTREIVAVHEWLGIGVNDPRTTAVPAIPFQVLDQNMMGGGEAAPVHLLLALIVGGILIHHLFRRRADRRDALYAAPFAAFLLFCVMLRWQPWHLRLQAPAFVLLGAMSGPLLVQSATRWVRVPIAALALAFLAYSACDNYAKPLVGPRNIFNASMAELDVNHLSPLFADLRQAAPVIESLHPKLLDLQLSLASLEFPILLAAREMAGPQAHIANFNPNFARDTGPSWYHQDPDAVLSWMYQVSPAWGNHYKTGTHYYPLLKCANGLVILVPTPPKLRKPTH